MSRRSGLRTAIGSIAATALVLTLGACSDTPDDTSDDTTSSEDPAASADPSTSDDAPTDPSADVVRAALGAVPACALLDGLDALYAETPHSCEGQLDGARVRLEVGVPFDATARETAEPSEVEGLQVWTLTEPCASVFGAGPDLGIAVVADDSCDALPAAARAVAEVLAGDDLNDLDDGVVRAGSALHTACGLLADGVADPTLLADGSVTGLRGLDECTDGSGGAVQARTSLSLRYLQQPFSETADALGGRVVDIAGREGVVEAGDPSPCRVHTYLWSTRAEGRGPVSADVTISAADCDLARSTAVAVVGAVEQAAPGPVVALSDLLVRSE